MLAVGSGRSPRTRPCRHSWCLSLFSYLPAADAVAGSALFAPPLQLTMLAVAGPALLALPLQLAMLAAVAGPALFVLVAASAGTASGAAQPASHARSGRRPVPQSLHRCVGRSCSQKYFVPCVLQPLVRRPQHPPGVSVHLDLLVSLPYWWVCAPSSSFWNLGT
jgi:hypothetical protein